MLLGGFILPVSGVAEGMSYAMIGHWSSAAMGTTAELNRLYYQTVGDEPAVVEDNPLLEQVNYDPSVYDSDPRPKSAAESRDDRRGPIARYLGIQVLITGLFLGGTVFFQWRKDAGWRR
jgi:hypothetical protein